MAKQNTRNTGEKDMANWKPGSEAAEAKKVGGKGDFGVPAGAGPSPDRDYVSENTKRSDRGAAMPRAAEHEGVRTSGAGANAGGDGAGSGGDIDTDVIGVGAGGSGVAQSGPGGRIGKGESDGSSDEMASGGHAQGRHQDDAGRIGGSKRVSGATVRRSDDLSSLPEGQGADAATNPAARGDDSFAAEISSGEASGDDLGMSPSSDTQGLSQEDNQGYQKDFGKSD